MFCLFVCIGFVKFNGETMLDKLKQNLKFTYQLIFKDAHLNCQRITGCLHFLVPYLTS